MPSKAIIPRICGYCGKPFLASPYYVIRGKANFCSRPCGRLQRMPTIESVWRFIDSGGRGCWEWTGSRDTLGYGRINIECQTFKAHRLLYTLVFGDLPPDKPFVCHRCNNPPCVRPSHLYADDSPGNSRYMAECGRASKGAQHHRATAKLTEAVVLEMRRRFADGLTYQAAALEYGISHQTAKRAIDGQTWSHLSSPL